MKVEQKEVIQGWYREAEKDLETVAILFQAQPEPDDVLCFHWQQAAEKYLKALLVFYGQEPPRVHDIRQLIAIILQNDATILQLADAVALNDYAVRVRYADHIEIDDKSIAEKALELASQVRRLS